MTKLSVDSMIVKDQALKRQRGIKPYDEAIRRQPQSASAYKKRGQVYYSFGHHRLSIQDYNEAIQIDPQDVLAYNDRGAAYHQLSQLGMAD